MTARPTGVPLPNAHPSAQSLSFLGAPGSPAPALRLLVRLRRPARTPGPPRPMELRDALATRARPAATMLGEIKRFLAAAGEDARGVAAANAVVVCWQEMRSGPNESWRTVVTEDNFDSVVMLLGRDGAATVVDICEI